MILFSLHPKCVGFFFGPMSRIFIEMTLKDKIDKYFESLITEDGTNPATFSGLALALGYVSRQSLWENATSGKPISLPLKKAMLKIESKYEERLQHNSCTGAIFALKQRGWKDTQEIEHSGQVTIIDDIR